MKYDYELLFKYAQFHYDCRACVEFCYSKNRPDLLILWGKHAQTIIDIVEVWRRTDFEAAESFYNAARKIADNIEDLILCASVYENEIIPGLNRFLSTVDKREISEGNYNITNSLSGAYTVLDTSHRRYLHSEYNPLYEARKQAESIYSPKADEAVIIGDGLGYLSYELYELSQHSLKITVLQNDANLNTVAQKYGVYNLLPKADINIVAIENTHALFEMFIDKITTTDNCIFWISDYMIEDFADEEKNVLRMLNKNNASLQGMKPLYDINFWKNKNKFDGTLSDLGQSSIRDFIIVAAGPSLNQNIDFIRSSIGSKKIIAVSTALKRLLKEGIKPDYVCVLDPKKYVCTHLEGITDEVKNIPVIAERLAFCGFLNKYSGPAYSVYSNDYEPAVIEAEESNQEIIDFTRTVTNLAIEIAVRLGAGRVFLVGADLAFPGNKHYAQGAGAVFENDVVGGISVRAVDGGFVSTSETFDSFRCRMEEIIGNNPDVVFINMSSEGAYIKGTLCGKWWEHFPKNSEGDEYFGRLMKEEYLSWREKYYLLKQICVSETGTLRKPCKKAYETFDVISVKAKEEIAAGINPKTVNNDFIILLTGQFAGASDPIACKILEDAYTLETQANKRVMIVNTCEFLGGEKVAVEKGYVFEQYELANAETVVYNGRRFMYYQFENDMPRVDYIREFLAFIENHAPERIISYDPFSILADICSDSICVKYYFEQ